MQPAAPAAQPPKAVEAEGYLASNFLGESVYNGTGANAENIGDVNDIVIGSKGEVQSVVIGVGGFLGIGEKSVAIEFPKLSWVEANGDRWLVTDASKEQLEALPDFDRSPYEPATPPTASIGTETAPATTTPLPRRLRLTLHSSRRLLLVVQRQATERSRKSAPFSARTFLSGQRVIFADHAAFGELAQRQRLVEMLGAPGQQPFGHIEPGRAIGRVASHIPRLVRIFRKIEQHRRQAAAEMHVFEFFRSHHGEVALARADAEMLSRPCAWRSTGNRTPNAQRRASRRDPRRRETAPANVRRDAQAVSLPARSRTVGRISTASVNALTLRPAALRRLGSRTISGMW